jgi:hypothetical protein
MAIFHCANKAYCPGSDDALLLGLDDAISSFSAEDVETYPPAISVVFNDPDPNNDPWTSQGCLGVCESHFSQLDADLCAKAQSAFCLQPFPKPKPEPIPPIDPDPPPPGGGGGGGCTLPPCDQPNPTPKPNPVPPPRKDYCNGPITIVALCPDGSESTYTFPAGVICDNSQSKADALAYVLASTIGKGHQLCLGDLSPTSICEGDDYEGSIGVLTDYTGPISWSVEGLPGGLTYAVDSTQRSIKITGTTTTGGDYQVSVTVTTGDNRTKSKSYKISVLAIHPESDDLETAIWQQHYSQQISADPDTITGTWHIVGGRLPAGLTLDERTGLIDGTPTETGNFHITVEFDQTGGG